MRVLPGLAAACLLCAAAIPAPAFAQDIAAAEAFFNRGLADMNAGRYETGCKAIAESHRIDPRAGTLFTLAVCEAQWGRTATAAARFGEYLSLYERLSPEQKARQGERPKVAKAQRQALAREVPELTLELPPGAPASTVVTRDGAVLADAALGVALPVDPGEHVVTTQVPGGPVGEQRITLRKGEKQQITLLVKAAQVVSVASPAGDQGPTGPGATGRHVPTWAWASGGVGLAALGVGVAFAVDYANVRRTVATNCPGNVCDADKYTLEAAQALRGRWNRDLGLFLGCSTVSVLGVGAAVANLVMAKGRTDHASHAPATAITPWFSPGAAGAFVHGAF